MVPGRSAHTVSRHTEARDGNDFKNIDDSRVKPLEGTAFLALI